MAHSARNTMGWRMRAGLLASVGATLAAGTLPAVGAVAPSLGAARTFGVLGASTVSNTGSTTLVTGDVGVSPGSSITGFGPGQVTGGIYVGGDPEADNAHNDAALAYTFLAGMASIPANNLTGQDLGGMTLAPDVYKFNSSAQLTGQLFLDAGGDSGAVFIFQIGSTLTTGSGASVTVINGGADYDESNVFWQVGSSATIGSGSAFVGNILAYADITIVSGSSMVGNALAIGGSVTTDSNAITSPPLAAQSPPPPTGLTAAPFGLVACEGMDLSWMDASDSETEFRVFRRDGAGPDFVQVGTVVSLDTPGTGATVTFQDLGVPPSTTLTYHVTAYGLADGESLPSEEALVETCDSIPPDVLAPTGLTATPIVAGSCSGTDLAWTDASDNETEFRVYRRDGAGPDFALVGTVASTDTPGTGATVAYQDLVLDPARTYTYRVTAVVVSVGEMESAPSNEALSETCVVVPPPARWVDVHLGRGRGFIADRRHDARDRVIVKGSFTVIDISTSIPTVVEGIDPRADGVTVQVRAPGSLALLVIPAGSPRWKASGDGIYRWKSEHAGNYGVTSLRIDTRKSEFTFKSKRGEFGSVPVNDVTVSLSIMGGLGSDTRAWDIATSPPSGTTARLELER